MLQEEDVPRPRPPLPPTPTQASVMTLTSCIAQGKNKTPSAAATHSNPLFCAHVGINEPASHFRNAGKLCSMHDSNSADLPTCFYLTFSGLFELGSQTQKVGFTVGKASQRGRQRQPSDHTLKPKPARLQQPRGAHKSDVMGSIIGGVEQYGIAMKRAGSNGLISNPI